MKAAAVLVVAPVGSAPSQMSSTALFPHQTQALKAKYEHRDLVKIILRQDQCGTNKAEPSPPPTLVLFRENSKPLKQEKRKERN